MIKNMEELNEDAGFYKWIGNDLHWGRIVNFPDGRKLYWELRDTYEYPYEGWVWYDEKPENTESNLFFTAPITKP